MFRNIVFLMILSFYFFSSCDKKKEQQSEKKDQVTVKKKADKPDTASKSVSWIDESESDKLTNTWVDEADAGQLSSTWAEDAFDEDSGNTMSNSWVAEDGSTIYKKTEMPPSFIGGQQALYLYFADHIVYPNDVERGNIYVAFIVGADGKIRDARVVKGVKESMDKIALELISNMPLWDPAEQDGQAVDCIYGLPILFRP